MRCFWVRFGLCIAVVFGADESTDGPSPKEVPCFKPELYKTFETCHNEHEHIPDEIDAEEKEKLQNALIECTLSKMDAFDENGRLQSEKFRTYLTNMAADHVDKEAISNVVKKCCEEYEEAKEKSLMELMECLGHNMAEICKKKIV